MRVCWRRPPAAALGVSLRVSPSLRRRAGSSPRRSAHAVSFQSNARGQHRPRVPRVVRRPRRLTPERCATPEGPPRRERVFPSRAPGPWQPPCPGLCLLATCRVSGTTGKRPFVKPSVVRRRGLKVRPCRGRVATSSLSAAAAARVQHVSFRSAGGGRWGRFRFCPLRVMLLCVCADLRFKCSWAHTRHRNCWSHGGCM